MIKAQYCYMPVQKLTDKCGLCCRSVDINLIPVLLEVKQKPITNKMYIDITPFHNGCFNSKLQTLRKFNIEIEELTINDVMQILEELEVINSRYKAYFPSEGWIKE